MYKLNKDAISKNVCSVTKTEDGLVTCIPFDPANTDYQQYQLWLADGNTPLPADGE